MSSFYTAVITFLGKGTLRKAVFRKGGSDVIVGGNNVAMGNHKMFTAVARSRQSLKGG